tara:strand:- start:32583 stop:33158 length:576 start_codon:yes stop_codon:yes gene_type:complete
MFTNRGHTLVNDIYDADVVLFTGGSDVTPELYGQEKHPATMSCSKRDEEECKIFQMCYLRAIPMVGICRGAQFLNVMSGGSMFQDVSGHTLGDHEINTSCGLNFEVTSTHHQMMKPSDEGILLATANESLWREEVIEGNISRDTWDNNDAEAVFYPKTRCFCYQPHPEFLEIDSQCQEYFFDMIDIKFGVK